MSYVIGINFFLMASHTGIDTVESSVYIKVRTASYYTLWLYLAFAVFYPAKVV